MRGRFSRRPRDADARGGNGRRSDGSTSRRRGGEEEEEQEEGLRRLRGLKVGVRGGVWRFEWQVRAANYGCGNVFGLLDSITY